jgi:hypothetical protein
MRGRHDKFLRERPDPNCHPFGNDRRSPSVGSVSTVLWGSILREALCMTNTTPSGETSSYTSLPASKNHVVVRLETVSR